MFDLIREAPLGQAIRFVSRNKLLQHPEEKADFQLPDQYTSRLKHNETNYLEHAIHVNRERAVNARIESSSATPQSTISAMEEDLEVLGMVRSLGDVRDMPPTTEQLRAEKPWSSNASNLFPSSLGEHPMNWSSLKKSFVVIILCTYTWVVYCAGPIYAAAADGVVEHFGVSHIAASLGLSLYVLEYGVGDLVFSPLTEIPAIGRNPVYYLTFTVFWVLSFPTAVVDDFGGLLALRFWLEFFGSPALANGGATIGDMFSLVYLPYGLSWWVFSAWGGPAIGPLIGGFAAMTKGWRWPLWEVVWMSSPVLLLLLLLMPETSSSTILLRRAQRLRKLTGDSRLQSQSEIEQQDLAVSSMLISVLVRPMEIMLKGSSVFFVNVYTGYFYRVFYTFFEVFPLVFPPLYGFNVGQTGLAFLSCLISVIFGIAAFFTYIHLYMIPDNIKNGLREQEQRLIPAIVGSFLIPAGLFISAWTADPDIHWIAPLVGVAIFVIGHSYTMQSLFVYLPFSYPRYAASIFAGNSIWRSGTAGGSIVFARPLFVNIGIHRGVLLLGGLSVTGIFGTIAIYIFGKRLRARSKFVQS